MLINRTVKDIPRSPDQKAHPKMHYKLVSLKSGEKDEKINLKRQVILSLQEPKRNLHAMSDHEFFQFIKNAYPGATAEKIFRRDKTIKDFTQELVTLPRDPKSAAPLKTQLHEDHIKMYIIGHCKAGMHSIWGTAGTWTVDDFADYIMQNFTAAPPHNIVFRISVIACKAGLAKDGKKSFAEALNDALRERFAKMQITNVELQIVARNVNISRGKADTDYTAQNTTKNLVGFTDEGQCTVTMTGDVQRDLEFFNMIEQEPTVLLEEDEKPAHATARADTAQAEVTQVKPASVFTSRPKTAFDQKAEIEEPNRSAKQQNNQFHISDHYVATMDGQAVIYKKLFAETRALFKSERKLFANTRAAYNKQGKIFANTMATLFGNRPILANLRYALGLLSEKQLNDIKTKVKRSPK